MSRRGGSRSARVLTAALLACAAGLACGDPGGQTVAEGEAIIEQRACRSCHVIGARGARVGPDLNQVSIRRTEDWLLRWLADPAAMKPDTMMLTFDWQAGEREALIAYLRALAQPVDADAILARTGGGAAGGKALIEAYQCHACHKVAGEEGRALYPDLDTIAERRDAAWERRWLADPQAVKPGTFMPTFGFSDAEIDAIVEFLYR